jgi:hypothetical protein
MIVQAFSDKINKVTLLDWVDLPKSTFFYKSREGKGGVKASTHTHKMNGDIVENAIVVEEIKGILNQEFTHIATPEENSYIEAFHSIVQREVIDRCEFCGYYDAKSTIKAHLIWYNNRRRHKVIGMTPAKPPFAQFSESLSRTTEDKDGAMAVARNILDQDGENGYICLSEMTKTDQNYKSDSNFLSN